MGKQEELALVELLRRRSVEIVGRIVEDQAGNGRYFVFVSVSRDSANKQVPSNRTLRQISEEALRAGISVEFVLTDSRQLDVEAGLRATLLHSFGQLIRNVFLQLERGRAIVWIDPKVEIEERAIAAMEEKASLCLKQVGFEFLEIASTKNESLPSKLVCLRAIRLMSPVLAGDLIKKLKSDGFVVPSDEWMNRRLDALRKSGQIVRETTGRYMLTLAGLQGLGSRKDRNSPDVARMLAVARNGR